MQTVLISAGLALISGPLLHHVAVAVGNDRSILPSEARCRRCSASHGRVLAACRACGLGVLRPLAFSLLFGLVAAGFAGALGAVAVLPAYLFMAGMSLVLFLTDIDHKRIPNRITYPGTPLAAALLVTGAVIDGTAAHLGRALASAAAYTGVLFLVYLVSRGGFGFGDVKLAVPLGLFLGFLGWGQLVVAAFATAFLGGVFAVAAVVAGGARGKSEIPYGPPMIIGAWIAIIGGPELAAWLL